MPALMSGMYLFALGGAAVIVFGLLWLIGRTAMRRLRRFVRAFWPH